MLEFTLKQAVSEEDVLKVMVVRGIVFIEEQDVDWEGEIDAYEKESIHFLGEYEGEPIAAGRLRELEDGWWKVERIAVRPKWRGRGFARDMVEFLMKHALENDAISVLSSSQS